jgi:hypothetical protein
MHITCKESCGTFHTCDAHASLLCADYTMKISKHLSTCPRVHSHVKSKTNFQVRASSMPVHSFFKLSDKLSSACFFDGNRIILLFISVHDCKNHDVPQLHASKRIQAPQPCGDSCACTHVYAYLHVLCICACMLIWQGSYLKWIHG